MRTGLFGLGFGLLYLSLVIGVIIFVLDTFRRIARALEELATANTRQAQAFETLVQHHVAASPKDVHE